MQVSEQQLQEALILLFEKYWILRKDSIDHYRLLRQAEKDLRRIINEKFGFRLTMHSEFVKLEKIPVSPEPWMGIRSFSQTMDYVLFSCLLSILEGKEAGEYFLLSQLCEEVQLIYPPESRVDWVNYNHRKSFVRAMQEMLDLHLLETLDGDLEQFKQNEEAEVLYRTTVYSDYFMRPYPQDIYQYDTWRDLLEEEAVSESDSNLVRHKVYRRLFLQPAIQKTEVSDEEFYYLRNQRQSILDFVERYTPYNFELYKDVAFLSSPERKQDLNLFPTALGIDDVILHLAATLREKNPERKETGSVFLTRFQLEELVRKTKEDYGEGWSKEYREVKSVEEISRDVFDRCKDWNFVLEQEDGIVINSVMVRSIGKYGEDKGGK